MKLTTIDQAQRVVASKPKSVGRWIGAVLSGTIAALPLGWLLSFGASLPFFLGLFFFVLFGLLIGAVMFRIGLPCRPLGRWPVILGTCLVVLMTWTISVVKEARDFPGEMAERIVNSTRDLGGLSRDEFRTAVIIEIDDFLRQRYSPGGTIGYLKWVVASGELKDGDTPKTQQKIARPQRGTFWIVRVVLSIAFLSFGIGSQTMGLTNDSSTKSVEPDSP
ncbi:MAG: hypothetical protein AABZ47_02885 [Planctomycetota bacterium]